MQVKQNSKDEIFFPVNILEKKRKKKRREKRDTHGLYKPITITNLPKSRKRILL